MGDPVHAGHLFGVEGDFLVQRAAQRVQHGAFDGAARAFGVDDESAVVRAHQALHPNVARLPVHFHLGDLGRHGLAAEGIGDASAGENVSRAGLFPRGTRLPAIRFCGRLNAGDGSRPFEAAVVRGTGL